MPKQTFKLLKTLKRKGDRKARQALILQLVGEGMTMTYIAKQLGISRQRVHQLARGHASN